MTYKDELIAANNMLAADPQRVFLGYGITRGRAGGTLRDVPAAQLIEMPVAENLMVGAAIGLALRGRKPVVYFERFDFVLNALDAIVNHLDALPKISRGEFSPAAILRIVVGNGMKPLFTGHTHTRNHASALELLVGFPVYTISESDDVGPAYALAVHFLAEGKSSALIEYKDLI